jgi:hypothetical protein
LHPGRDLLDLFVSFNVLQQHDKFVASMPGDRIHLTQATRQASSDFPQYLVPSGMPQAIVDLFEVVKINEEQGK